VTVTTGWMKLANSKNKKSISLPNFTLPSVTGAAVCFLKHTRQVLLFSAVL